jgi:hypothetical protein
MCLQGGTNIIYILNWSYPRNLPRCPVTYRGVPCFLWGTNIIYIWQ